jgi:DNA-binding NarL/FixJ family response regulator
MTEVAVSRTSEVPALERPLRVLVVDDHDVVHWGLRIMLERMPWVDRALSAHDGSEAVAVATRELVDVALVDLFVGSESGPDICERLHEVRPGIRVLLISGAGQISARAAASCGASGFVSKDLRGVDILRAVRAIAMGATVFEAKAEPESLPATRRLSEREREVLSLMAAGATNREIADRLHLSQHTVKEYASSVYRKLEVRNRLQAGKRAEKLGLLG